MFLCECSIYSMPSVFFFPSSPFLYWPSKTHGWISIFGIENREEHSGICLMQISYWETDSCSASQEIPRIFWKSKFDYRVYNILPLGCIQSQINFCTSSGCIYRGSILILSFHILLNLPNDFSFQFSFKILYAFFIFPIHCTCKLISFCLTWQS